MGKLCHKRFVIYDFNQHNVRTPDIGPSRFHVDAASVIHPTGRKVLDDPNKMRTRPALLLLLVSAGS